MPFRVGPAYTRRAIYETMPTKPEDLDRTVFRSLFLFDGGNSIIIYYSLPTSVRQSRVHYGAHFTLCTDRPIRCSARANIIII